MSESTLDHDDLTPTQEYFITGLVILLFGLLYWFLNHGFKSDLETTPSVSTRHLQMDADGHALGPFPVSTNLAATAAITGATANTTEKPPVTATPVAAKAEITLPESSHASNQPKPDFQVKSDKPVAGVAAASMNATVATSAATSGLDATPLKAENETINQTELETAKVAAGIDKTNIPSTATTATTANNSEQKPPAEGNTDNSSYSLPDGSQVKIAPNGFENNFKNALTNGELNKPITFDKIYFESGSTAISAQSNDQIRATAALLHKHPNTKVLIRGHSDNTGLPANNVQLSLMRANAMGLALGNVGIDTNRILVAGMGATQPIDTNATKQGRHKNRRIEILITQ